MLAERIDGGSADVEAENGAKEQGVKRGDSTEDRHVC